jgi:hypothetical protein
VPGELDRRRGARAHVGRRRPHRARFNGSGVDLLAGVRANDSGQGGSCNMTADLAGDYRDEVVCVVDNKVMVFSNLEPAARREVTHTADREYRLWLARNMGGGYPSYFEWEK